jgi:hypothetical protein
VRAHAASRPRGAPGGTQTSQVGRGCGRPGAAG